jgi:hypothetical protein
MSTPKNGNIFKERRRWPQQGTATFRLGAVQEAALGKALGGKLLYVGVIRAVGTLSQRPLLLLRMASMKSHMAYWHSRTRRLARTSVRDGCNAKAPLGPPAEALTASGPYCPPQPYLALKCSSAHLIFFRLRSTSSRILL